MTTEKYSSGLHPQHQAKLASSGISSDVAAERGYTTADNKAQLERAGLAPSQRIPPALLIPLHNVLGERWGVQARPDEPRMIKGKAVKYETAAGTKLGLDVPPRVLAHLGDPSRPLIITEGPLKADAAVSAGLDAVAFLGVWAFRATNTQGGTVVIPDLENIAVNGRRVIIAFDSDVQFKPPVRDAMARLGALLSHRGADVLYAYLPSGRAGEKVGLDDWLVRRDGPTAPADALMALCEPKLRRLATDPSDGIGDEDTFDDVEEEPGAQVLDDVATFMTRYVAFPSGHAHVAVALWAAHSHAVTSAESTPRLAFLSPEMGSGKTRSLEVLELLVARPLRAANLTSAALYRLIDSRKPTLLIDEIDTIFGPHAASHEDLRAVLDAGHRRGSQVYRCVGEGTNTEVAGFPAFAAVALAGLGDLPPTIADRSVVIKMRRRAPDEAVLPFRLRDAVVDGLPLQRRLAAWAKRNADDLEQARPIMPAELTDRPADVWEPLLAIADQAGGAWPRKAREAAIFLVEEARAVPATLGVKLLTDIRTILGNVKRMASKELVDRLVRLEESPWGDMRRPGEKASKSLDARDLAVRLRPYGITPKTIRVGGSTPKCYERADFYDAWRRYLAAEDSGPSNSQPTSAEIVTTVAAQRAAARKEESAEGRLRGTGRLEDSAAETNVADVSDVSVPQGGPSARVRSQVAEDDHAGQMTATAAEERPRPTACDCQGALDGESLHNRGCPSRPRMVSL